MGEGGGEGMKREREREGEEIDDGYTVIMIG